MLLIFLIALIAGILLIVFGKKSKTLKIILILAGIILALFGAYGIFTFYL